MSSKETPDEKPKTLGYYLEQIEDDQLFKANVDRALKRHRETVRDMVIEFNKQRLK